jgi:hypothetical protein
MPEGIFHPTEIIHPEREREREREVVPAAEPGSFSPRQSAASI